MSVRIAAGLVVMALGASPIAAETVRGVLANGGVTASGGGLMVKGTAGQPAVGTNSGGGLVLCSGFWCVGVVTPAAVPPPGGSNLPRVLSIGFPAPNPARGITRFALALPRAATVSISVFDVAGRQLGEARTERLEAGQHELWWSAPSGPAGVYFARIAVDGIHRAWRRIVLVR